MKSYDIIVLGSGGAGFQVAIAAKKVGKNVAVSYKDEVYSFALSGVCAKILRKWEAINWLVSSPLNVVFFRTVII